MALKKCKDCGKEASPRAKICPHCGAPAKKKSSCMNVVVLLFLALLIGAIVTPTGDEERPPDESKQDAKPTATTRLKAQPSNTDETHTRPAPEPLPTPDFESRTWTDQHGRTIHGEYISSNNGIVKISDDSGNTHTVSMWNLSEDDQKYVVSTKGWEVVKVFRHDNVKASLDVRLSQRVERAKLIEIANELHQYPENKQPRLFILYYLPGMVIDTGAWASTHFTPNLEVRIIGTSKEDYAELERVAQEDSTGEDTIGRWMDKTAFEGVLTLYRKNGKVFKTKVFADGSKGEYEMVVRKVNGQFRYSEKDDKLGDYLVILPDGNLGHGDKEVGIWETSPKVR